jgi:hypothetical protein
MNENLEKIKNALQIDNGNYDLGIQCSEFFVKELERGSKEPRDSLKKVKIAVPIELNEYFAFSPDDFLNGKNSRKEKYLFHPLLVHNEDYQKCCDKVIILLNNNDLKMIFIEMKNSLSNGNLAKARIQLYNTKCFFRHLVNLVIGHLKIRGGEKDSDSFRKTLERLRDNQSNFLSVIFTADSSTPLVGKRKPVRGSSNKISIPEDIKYIKSGLNNSSVINLRDLMSKNPQNENPE